MQFYILFIKTWYTLIYCAIIAFFLCFVFIFYISRHTWATLAKYCNFSEQLICEAFGHSSVKVTETYLKNFKNEEIKKANDAIILYVSKNGKKRAWIDKKLIIKLFKFRYFVSNRIYSAAKIDNKSIANKKQPASFF